MIRITIFAFFALIILSAQLQAYQSLTAERAYDTWKVYTSHRSIKHIEDISLSQSNALAVLTTGGFYILRDGDSALLFNTADGKYQITATSMAYDRDNQKLWFSYPDGMLSSFDLNTNRFRHFNDISRNDRFVSNRINDLFFENGLMYIATDFGVVIFDVNLNVVLDSYNNLGRLASSAITRNVIVETGIIYAGTDFGIVVGDPANGDLKIAENWQNFDNQNGFIDRAVTSIAVDNGVIYATSEEENYRFSNGNWEITNRFGSHPIQSVRQYDTNTWLVTTLRNLYLYDTATEEVTPVPVADSWMYQFNDAISYNESIIVGTERNGLGFVDSGTSGVDFFQPNAPSHNLFEDFIVAENGDVVGASSSTPGQFSIGFNDTGFYIFRDGIWNNINNVTNQTMSQLGLNSFFRTAVSGNNYFFGLWGGGVVRYNRETEEISRYNAQNSDLVGLPDAAPNFYVGIGLSADRSNPNYIWSVAWVNGVNPLARYDIENQEWVVYDIANNIGVGSYYRSIFVDSYGQKWIPLTTSNLIGRGLLVLDNPEGGSQQQFRLTSDEELGNLPNDVVNTIIQDKRGEVWVGTNRGIGRFIFPERIITGSVLERRSQPLINEDTTAFDRVLLRDVHVTAMAVDPNNQKWIGSNGDGIYLIEETGRRVIRHFTVDNSPLTSNNIKSIALKTETGEVFISTDKGLNVYTALEREPFRNMESLRIYPNPYSYSRDGNVPIVIEDLSDDATVHILTVDGRMVRRFATRGGRVEWDGRDAAGREVSTGVYIIVATGNNNDQRGRGRLLIIR